MRAENKKRIIAFIDELLNVLDDNKLNDIEYENERDFIKEVLENA